MHYKRLLVVGAGASFAEGQHIGLPSEQCLPLMPNFASRLWSNGTGFYPYCIEFYLASIGIEPGEAPLETFISASKDDSSRVNVEHYFEYIWNLSENFITFRQLVLSLIPNHSLAHFNNWKNLWEQLCYWGLRQPLELIVIGQYWNQATQSPRVDLAERVARFLTTSDLVLNLNYDTLFEVALENIGYKISYAPFPWDNKTIYVAKPHGSLNLVFDQKNQSYGFGPANCYGHVPTENLNMVASIVPPRFRKNTKQHYMANAIFNTIYNFDPEIITFWGIGLTPSDRDLFQYFFQKCQKALKIEFINPDTKLVNLATNLLKTPIYHYQDINEWLNDNKQDQFINFKYFNP